MYIYFLFINISFEKKKEINYLNQRTKRKALSYIFPPGRGFPPTMFSIRGLREAFSSNYTRFIFQNRLINILQHDGSHNTQATGNLERKSPFLIPSKKKKKNRLESTFFKFQSNIKQKEAQ